MLLVLHPVQYINQYITNKFGLNIDISVLKLKYTELRCKVLFEIIIFKDCFDTIGNNDFWHLKHLFVSMNIEILQVLTLFTYRNLLQKTYSFVR